MIEGIKRTRRIKRGNKKQDANGIRYDNAALMTETWRKCYIPHCRLFRQPDSEWNRKSLSVKLVIHGIQICGGLSHNVKPTVWREEQLFRHFCRLIIYFNNYSSEHLCVEVYSLGKWNDKERDILLLYLQRLVWRPTWDLQNE